MVQQQVTVLTAEAAYEGNGWNAYAAALYQITAPYHGGSEFEDYGLVVQGGYFVTDNVEAFGRWDGIFSDSACGPGLNGDLNTFTFGANWYLFPQSHAAKITGDVQWTVDGRRPGAPPVAGILAGNNVGLLPSEREHPVALRLQFQLLF